MNELKEFDPRDFYHQIGIRLRQARIEAGRTQDEVAHAINLTRASVANIELGRQNVTLHGLYLAARFLDCDITTLLNGEWIAGEPSEPPPLAAGGADHPHCCMAHLLRGSDEHRVPVAVGSVGSDLGSPLRGRNGGHQHPLRAEDG